MTVEERARLVEEVLDSKGFVNLPASGMPGATEEQMTEMRERLDEVIEHLGKRRPIQVTVAPDGGMTIYAAHTN